jgi:hypothetical protein
MKIKDPRNISFSLDVSSHQGPKPQKFCWLSEEKLLSIGFSKKGAREFAIWDLKKFDSP